MDRKSIGAFSVPLLIIPFPDYHHPFSPSLCISVSTPTTSLLPYGCKPPISFHFHLVGTVSTALDFSR
jgi:hypothetical protein